MVECEIVHFGAVDQTIIIADLDSPVAADVKADTATDLDVTTLVLAVLTPECDRVRFVCSRTASD